MEKANDRVYWDESDQQFLCEKVYGMHLKDPTVSPLVQLKEAQKMLPPHKHRKIMTWKQVSWLELYMIQKSEELKRGFKILESPQLSFEEVLKTASMEQLAVAFIQKLTAQSVQLEQSTKVLNHAAGKLCESVQLFQNAKAGK